MPPLVAPLATTLMKSLELLTLLTICIVAYMSIQFVNYTTYEVKKLTILRQVTLY